MSILTSSLLFELEVQYIKGNRGRTARILAKLMYKRGLAPSTQQVSQGLSILMKKDQVDRYWMPSKYDWEMSTGRWVYFLKPSLVLPELSE